MCRGAGVTTPAAGPVSGSGVLKDALGKEPFERVWRGICGSDTLTSWSTCSSGGGGCWPRCWRSGQASGLRCPRGASSHPDAGWDPRAGFLQGGLRTDHPPTDDGSPEAGPDRENSPRARKEPAGCLGRAGEGTGKTVTEEPRACDGQRGPRRERARRGGGWPAVSTCRSRLHTHEDAASHAEPSAPRRGGSQGSTLGPKTRC